MFASELLGSSGFAMVNFRTEVGASLLVNEATSSSFGVRVSTDGCAALSILGGGTRLDMSDGATEGAVVLCTAGEDLVANGCP